MTTENIQFSSKGNKRYGYKGAAGEPFLMSKTLTAVNSMMDLFILKEIKKMIHCSDFKLHRFLSG